MSPYAVLYINGSEAFRTSPARKAHKSPTWTAVFASQGVIPDEVTVAVWDKSDNHRDTLCGHVTIPCTPESARLDNKQFQIHKASKPTGSIIVSWEVKHGPAKRAEAMLVKQDSHLGHEMDLIVSRVNSGGRSPSPSRGTEKPLSLKQGRKFPEENETEDVSDDESKPTDAYNFPANTAPASNVLEEQAALQAAGKWLSGDWKCVATQGLEPFLIATGIGWAQRKIANAAAWPSWSFSIQDDRILFVNNAAIGVIKEEIPLNKDFTSMDGQKNPLESHATWIPSDNGGNLYVKRNGPLGKYREERTVTGNKLEFLLTNETVGCIWGRTFERVQN